jgi:hypothetical protein
VPGRGAVSRIDRWYWFRLKQVLAKGRFISRRDSMTHSLLERINAAHKGFPGKAAAG